MCRRRAAFEGKLARLRERRVRMLKKPSIWLSQDAGRREVEDDSWVGYEPVVGLGRLVSRRVVENDMQLALAEGALEPLRKPRKSWPV